MGMRENLANALNQTGLVEAEPYKPGLIQPGTAWIQWAGMHNDGDGLWINNWRALIALPVDDQAAAEWIQDNIPAVLGALSPWMAVTDVQPTSMSGDSVTLLVAQIDGYSE